MRKKRLPIRMMTLLRGFSNSKSTRSTHNCRIRKVWFGSRVSCDIPFIYSDKNHSAWLNNSTQRNRVWISLLKCIKLILYCQMIWVALYGYGSFLIETSWFFEVSFHHRFRACLRRHVLMSSTLQSYEPRLTNARWCSKNNFGTFDVHANIYQNLVNVQFFVLSKWEMWSDPLHERHFCGFRLHNLDRP